MIKVNLVPKEILDKEVQKQRVFQASIVAGLAVAMVVAVSTVHVFRARRLEAQLAELQVEYDKLAKIVAQVEELERTANAVKTRLNVITGLLKVRPLYPYFMTDLLATMPAGVWLTSLTTTSKDGPVQLGVNLASVSNTSEGVSQWLRNLEQSGKFEEAKLSGIAVAGAGDVKLHTFSIATGYKNPGL